MSRPTHIYTEDQFPLDEQAEESMVPDDGETFPVLVQWHDVQESPSQAVGRLNAEAMEQAGQAADALRAKVIFQQRIDRMAEFELHRPEDRKDRTNLVHRACGHIVGTIADTNFTTALDTLYERTVAHDCTITGLVQHATPGVQQLASRLLNLLEGRSTETVTRGYLVALTDLLWEALELPVERRRDVAEYLWDSAGPGDMPWPEEN